MAEFSERDEWERRLARQLGIELRRQFLGVQAALDAEFADPDETFWQNERTRIVGGIGWILATIFLSSAEQFSEAQPIAVDLGIINDRGLQWARSHTFDLVSGINGTTRATLRREIANALQEGLSTRDLAKRLAPTFGPQRAELIAVTETTNAAAIGQEQFARELAGFGVQYRRRWLTAQDERVCPICRPLDGQLETPEGGFTPAGVPGPGIPRPAAHPRCRCDLLYEPVGEGEVV